MSNPTTKVAQFNGSPDGFAVSGPERYSNGLWLEEGTTNEIANSSFETNATGWTNNATGNTVARATGQASVGTASLQVIGDGSTGSQGAYNNASSPSAASGDVWALSADVYAQGSESLRFVAAERTAAGASVVDTPGATLSLAAGWARRGSAIMLAGGAAVAQVRFKFVTPNAQAFSINLDAVQLEKKPYPTSYTPSTRAASSASIPTAGIISPVAGAVAFRTTPTIETGLEEIWGECGVKGSGTDHVRWGRDASKHPFVEWSSNDAAYQRLTGSETLNALTAYDLYLGHSATTISLAVDAGTLQTGTRDAISASWGAGNLTLEATAGGVIYNQFAAFNRTLSASEIRTLDRRNSWSRTMFGNPVAYFQLRPY